MKKIINNVVKEMNELIKLNKEKDDKIINLEFENSKLKEQLSSVDCRNTINDKINNSIYEKIDKANDNIITLIENCADLKMSLLRYLCPMNWKCPGGDNKSISCDECKEMYYDKMIEDMIKEYTI